MEPRVAVVGAGPAGLLAARELTRAGLPVRVFDKARGPGGRMATRRSGLHAFDLGAQYFTVRDERVRDLLAEWIRAGVVARWTPRLAHIGDGGVSPADDGQERYVGTPRMSALTRHLAQGVDVVPAVRVRSVRRDGAAWSLAAEAPLGRFDAVLVATPPEQAVPLLAEVSHLARRAAEVVSTPCWAATVVFPAPLALPFDAAFVRRGPLGWVARNASKPGRAPDEAWVLHATAAWSTDHLDAEPARVARDLAHAFLDAAGLADAKPAFLDAHRWALATATAPLGVGALWDPAARLGACGDWCAGLRVEGAILSGLAAGERVAATFGAPAPRTP